MTKALTRSAPIAGIAIILLALSANSVLAWGDTAHRIICEIAFKELNSQARAEVKRFIRLDPVFFTFSGSCTWADHPRKRSREHFVNLPRTATQLENDSCPLADKCVVTAIEVDLQIVVDAGASDANKLDALKFLGHWVGDVHQPLHVSFQDDRGGNRIKETGPCSRNLHAVLNHALGGLTDGRPVSIFSIANLMARITLMKVITLLQDDDPKLFRTPACVRRFLMVGNCLSM